MFLTKSQNIVNINIFMFSRTAWQYSIIPNTSSQPLSCLSTHPTSCSAFWEITVVCEKPSYQTQQNGLYRVQGDIISRTARGGWIPSSTYTHTNTFHPSSQCWSNSFTLQTFMLIICTLSKWRPNQTFYHSISPSLIWETGLPWTTLKWSETLQ